VAFGFLIWWAPGSARQDGGHFFDWIISFWVRLLRADLGPSFRGIGIEELVLEGAAISLPLVFCALLLSLTGALAVSFLLHDRRPATGRVLRTITHALSLTPVFLLGYIALIVFGIPPDGWLPMLASVVILALGDGMFSDVVLRVEVELTTLRSRDFVHSAALRGVPMFQKLLPHLALPLVEAAASRMAFLLGGIVVLEKVLGIPGLGWIGYRAAQEGDFILLLTITVFITALVAVGYLCLEMLRLSIDPRLRRRQIVEADK
jgi:peptide/nickel transport system permease protein